MCIHQTNLRAVCSVMPIPESENLFTEHVYLKRWWRGGVERSAAMVLDEGAYEAERSVTVAFIHEGANAAEGSISVIAGAAVGRGSKAAELLGTQQPPRPARPMRKAARRWRRRRWMRLADPVVLSRSPLPSAWASRPTLGARVSSAWSTPRAHALVFSAPVCMGQPTSSLSILFEAGEIKYMERYEFCNLYHRLF
jgi:hypothetical protein